MKTPFVVLVHVGILQTCLAKCYYPGGFESTDIPCDPDAEVSACCANGDSKVANACLSNKLCIMPAGTIARGGCTDPTFTSPDCPRYCMNVEGKGWNLVSCSNVTQKETSFCCDQKAGCCDSGLGRLEIEPSKPIFTWAVYDKSKSAYVVLNPLSTTTSSSISSSTSFSTGAASGSTSASDATTSSGTSASTISYASQATTGPSPSSTGSRAPAETGQSSAAQTEQSSGLSTGAQAGIGVGAAVGALLVLAVAYLWWKLKKTQEVIAATAAGRHGWHNSYPPPPPAPSYYPQDISMKHELQGDRETHELQGQSYYPNGDPRNTELSTQGSYPAVNSPVTTFHGVSR
ncbi:hypothetical protein N657DRAFT_647984 [Parathielavia appendiculata]|uniref:Uncharacterized protein n=1 Tax=Parathielavia appendiculata TaxID=2587402 RepID=A0AAN6Z188_9PEZI|nr:hypothetical protein N657DRAFT_647984 [Parathielavia appendiculata]